MRLKHVLAAAVGLLLFSPLPAAELSAVVAGVAAYESGKSAAALRQFEQLVRDAGDRPTERAALETALAQLLLGPATFEGKRFACHQLAAIGTDASLPALAELLKNDETVGIACLALSPRQSPGTLAALRAALPAARGAARLQLIIALGNHQDAAAVTPLASLARDADPETARTALIALARIGTPAARDAVTTLRRSAGPERAAAAAEASHLVASQLIAAGDLPAARSLLTEMLAPTQPAQIRRGAFDALRQLDADAGEQRILDALRGRDDVLKPVAIAAIPSVRSAGATGRFARELTQLSPDAQVLLLEVFAEIADAAAQAEIRRHVAASAVVRRAAIAALGRCGETADVTRFTAALAAAGDEDERLPVVAALSRLPGGEATDRAIAAEFERGPAPIRPSLLGALANRSSRLAVPVLLKAAAEPDPAVTKVAYRALGRLAAPSDLEAMLELLLRAAKPEVRRDAEAAIALVLPNVDDSGRRADLLLARLTGQTNADARSSLLRLLPVAGGAKSLAALESAMGDSDARVADAALRALAEWRDAEAWPALLALYRQPRSESYRVLALRALVRLAGAENARPTPALLERYRQLFAGAKGDSDLRLLLGAIAGVPHPEALPLVLPLLGNPAVRAEAELAVKKIAAAIRTQHPKVAQDALRQLK